MKLINKVKITSARDVKTIIKLMLITSINHSLNQEPIQTVWELHLSKDVECRIGETIYLQDLPCKINDMYTEIKDGHIYKILVVVFEKDADSEKSSDKQIKEFNKIYTDIIKGLKRQ